MATTYRFSATDGATSNCETCFFRSPIRAASRRHSARGEHVRIGHASDELMA